MKRGVHAIGGAKRLPNRKAFCREVSLWRLLLDLEQRSLPAA
jgi:hypothetical protein